MQSEHVKLGVIGGGKMAEAIVAGVLDAGLIKKNHVSIKEINSERVHYLKSRYGVDAGEDLCENIKEADLVLLAIKPQDFISVEAFLQTVVTRKSQVILTVLAGVPTRKIMNLFEFPVKTARIMPNLGAFVRKSVSAIYFNPSCEDSDVKFITHLFETIGTVLSVSEDKLDAVTAASGSGPAYVFYFLEAYVRSVVELGFTQEEAKSLCFKTMEGALSILLNSENNEPDVWRKQVTSKGGTTEQAIQVFESSDFNLIMSEALKAAMQRSIELSQ